MISNVLFIFYQLKQSTTNPILMDSHTVEWSSALFQVLVVSGRLDGHVVLAAVLPALSTTTADHSLVGALQRLAAQRFTRAALATHLCGL